MSTLEFYGVALTCIAFYLARLAANCRCRGFHSPRGGYSPLVDPKDAQRARPRPPTSPTCLPRPLPPSTVLR